ncbi:DUF4345 family protein [Kordiimonas laminariae]|uniref:DUF4345 family protein n=1 Tax=Kordiimonas laminariae TaxID=2917717 RepID=UPI001FF3D9B0|nr:DUF4345 family protein [Kordiimonas laminariae]MCK0068133.1 hypothetical protein [Kordiimonas laminariae]
MTKTNIGRGILTLIALFFLGNGLMVMFVPSLVLDHMLLGSLKSVSEISSARAFVGGMTIAIWSSVLLGAIKADRRYIHVGFFSLIAVIVARLTGYILDGSFPELLQITAPTVFFLTLLTLAYKLMTAEDLEKHI